MLSSYLLLYLISVHLVTKTGAGFGCVQGYWFRLAFFPGVQAGYSFACSRTAGGVCDVNLFPGDGCAGQTITAGKKMVGVSVR